MNSMVSRLFYSRTRKKNKCQLRGSVKTPSGDIMAWKKMQLRNYLKHGGVLRRGRGTNEVGIIYTDPYLSSYRFSAKLSEWSVIDWKTYNEMQKNPELFGNSHYVDMFLRRVRGNLYGDYFAIIYNLRQEKWAEKHDVDIKNAS